MNTIFTYGTLQEPLVQQSLIGRVAELRDATIEGFEMQTAYGGNYLALVSGEGEVEGKVFDVSDEELEIFDRYEGPAYRRITVFTLQGDETFVYVLEEDLPTTDA